MRLRGDRDCLPSHALAAIASSRGRSAHALERPALRSLSQTPSRTFPSARWVSNPLLAPGLRDCNSRVQIRVDPLEMLARFHKEGMRRPVIWSAMVANQSLVPARRDRWNEHGHLAVLARTQRPCRFRHRLLALPVILLVNRCSTRRSSGYTYVPHSRLPPHCQACQRSLTRKRSLVQIQYRPPVSSLVRSLCGSGSCLTIGFR